MSPAFSAGIREPLPIAQLTSDIPRPDAHQRRGGSGPARRPGELPGAQVESPPLAEASGHPRPSPTQRRGPPEGPEPRYRRPGHSRLNFQKFWTRPPEQSEGFLTQWCFSATRSRLAPVKEAASTIKQHWDGVLRKIDCATRSAQSGQQQTTGNSAWPHEGGGCL